MAFWQSTFAATEYLQCSDPLPNKLKSANISAMMIWGQLPNLISASISYETRRPIVQPKLSKVGKFLLSLCIRKGPILNVHVANDWRLVTKNYFVHENL